RTARGQTGYLDSATDLTNLLDTAGPTEFVGYSALVAETRILAIISEGEAVGEVPQGAEAEIILDRTPFYPEGGGQVSDSGVITSASGQLYVTEVRRAPSGVIVHRGRVGSGVLRVESEALATVD